MKNTVFKASVSTKKWAKAAAVRAIKTFAETCVALIPAGITISGVNWETVFGSAALSALISILTALAGLPEVSSEEEE